MSIYTAKGHQALRKEVVKLCDKAVQTYRDMYIGWAAVSDAVVPPVPASEPVLREVEFSDNYVYRWNFDAIHGGRLEYASKMHPGQWCKAEQVPMEDFAAILDLREKPYAGAAHE